MDAHDLHETIETSHRLIKAAQAALRHDVEEADRGNPYVLRTGCKETAAVRRASMDLTRTLAKLRGRAR